MIKKIIVLAILMAFTHPIFTQPATKNSVTKTFYISGYVDAYYMFDASKRKLNNRTSFTNSHNSLELGMASLTFEGTSGKLGFVADLGAGKRANEFDYTDVVGVARGIKQLYARYAPTDWVTSTLGSWGTHQLLQII